MLSQTAIDASVLKGYQPFTNAKIHTQKGNMISFTKLISISTDKKSVENSELLVKSLKTYIDSLPKGKLEFSKIEKVKKVIVGFKKNKDGIDNFIEPLKVISHKSSEANILFDNKDVCKMLENLCIASKQTLFVLDYLNTIVEVTTEKEKIKAVKPITAEEIFA